MSITVTVDLNPDGSWKRAVATKKRLARPSLFEEFVFSNREWVSTATGKPPNTDLLALINSAALQEASNYDQVQEARSK